MQEHAHEQSFDPHKCESLLHTFTPGVLYLRWFYVQQMLSIYKQARTYHFYHLLSEILRCSGIEAAFLLWKTSMRAR